MTLKPEDRRLVRLSAAVTVGDWDALRSMRRNAPDGEPNRAWREVLFQSHLFAGFPRLVEAYGLLAREGGLGELEPGELEAQARDDPERGRRLFSAIYGDQTESLLETLTSYHGDFGAAVLGYAYGRVLARPGLDAGRRELCAVAALCVTGQVRQLASHTRGALRCGATKDQVHGTVEAVQDWIPEPVREAVRLAVQRFSG